MKINKAFFYKVLLIIIILLQIYVPSFKFNIFFQIFALLFYFVFEKANITVSFIKTLVPILSVFLIGFIGFFFFRNPISFALKDIFHFIKPIQGLLLGYFIFKTINNKVEFVKIIVISGFISAILHLLILFVFVDLGSGSVSAIRQFTKDNFLELFAVFFLIYYKKFIKDADIFKSKRTLKIVFFTIIISSILYFSRTMIVGALILFLSLNGYTKITKKTLKIISLVIISICTLYLYLYSVKIDRGKPGLEAFLYKIKIAPEEIFKAKINRENHRDLWDHWRGYEAKRAFALMKKQPLSIVLGTGYGSLVNLKFKAPLTSDKKGLKYISELHNGYPYILYKTGIFGLLIYLFFLIKLYLYAYNEKSFESLFISAIGVFYLFSTFTITGIYNGNDTIVFILGGLLFGLKQHKLIKND
ncbi:O-antigen ligase family protein [Flavobacterium sp.]|uniref:O-antigen ligase family protein n=1 Tax=Flavobacterium sp. TaxID=239 RepID=UPI003D26823C